MCVYAYKKSYNFKIYSYILKKTKYYTYLIMNQSPNKMIPRSPVPIGIRKSQ